MRLGTVGLGPTGRGGHEVVGYGRSRSGRDALRRALSLQEQVLGLIDPIETLLAALRQQFGSHAAQQREASAT